MNKFLIICLIVAGSCCLRCEAQVSEAPSRGFYAGLQGGIPMGVSTFNSIGENKTNLGWNVGAYAGYQFNQIISADIFGNFGKANMTVRQCCDTYWLGADGVHSFSPAIDMQGWNYDNLKSKVTMQKYGARVNVNVLGFFNDTKNSRWNVSVSPSVSAFSTKTEIESMSDGNIAQKGIQKWHFGYGADLSIGYRFTKHLSAALYSGITMVSGSRIDALPKWCHSANYVWDSGVKVTLHFGSSKKKASMTVAEEAQSPSVAEEAPKQQQTIPAEETQKANEGDHKVKIPKQPERVIKEEPKSNDNVILFPDVYFSFNSRTVEASQIGAMNKILELLKNNPKTNVKITGWCDNRGSNTINDRISRQRAQAIKTWLIGKGISANRITAVGGGVNHAARTHQEARHAATIEINQGKESSK